MLSWPAALTLLERLALLRSGKFSMTSMDMAVAQQRLQRWQKEKVFAEQEGFFEERLAADKISESEFLSLLGTPATEFACNLDSRPEWASSIAEHSHESPFGPCLEQAILESEKTTGKPAMFLVAAAGFICAAQGMLHEGIVRLQQEVTELPFNPQTIEKALLKNILGLLSGMMNRTLVLELNVARIQGQLAGDTPEERFTSFLERLSKPETVCALWEEYPVLARQVVLSLDQWARNSIEFLERLTGDWPEIQNQFSPERKPGLLINLRTGAGDRHNNGHSVSIAEFECGFQLVYKPRSLATDRQFQKLLEWVNARRHDLRFQTLSILEKQDYGWAGYVDSYPCNSEEEIRRFYRRQGGYLALLYMVHATDFHSENLIACGEHPILVDLESLFHPNLFPQDNQDPLFFAHEQLSNSVFRIGLLPFRFAVNDDQQEGVEISGLGGAGKQKTPYPVGAWEGVATDEMRFVRKRIEMPSQRNRPRLQGTEVNALDYQQEIISGFADTYGLLEQNREELLSAHGPIAPFAHVRVRCIARPTQVYGSLLTESYHPNLLRDALDRERLFDNLWSEAQHNPVLKELISHEREDLWRNDVPVFTARPASPHLWNSSNEVIPDCLHETPLTLVQRRLQQMGAEDLDRQTWFIRAAMTALALEESEPRPVRSAPASALPGPEASPEDFLTMAIAAGEYLLKSAIRGAAGGVAWIGLDSVLERFWELTPTGMDLYNGIPGIALFLAYLGDATGDRRFISLAEDAVSTVLKSLEKFKPQPETPIGAFTGDGSLIYFLTHCGILWDHPDLLDEAEKRARSLSSRIPNDKSFDVISGSAGLIAVLLALYQHRASEHTLALAVQCGDHLLQHAHRTPQGTSWITLSNTPAPLTGFSHGTAGIAWALMMLASLTGERRFREVAIEALQYERTLFSPEQNNWPDLRAARLEDQTLRYAIAWCHGAPGIGLGRALVLEHYQDQEIYAEIGAAVQATLTRNLGINYSLCHGDLGNYETLLHATKIIRDPALLDRIRLLPSHILAGIRQHGWKCGVPLGVETPGLMVGVAGIGHGLLRLARPSQIPPVLALAPPIARKTSPVKPIDRALPRA